MTQQTDKPTTLEGISDQLTTTLEDISDQLTTIKADMEKSNERFNEYRQATQWVVQLAFGLIASATIITIVGTIFKR
jgi:molecular chaperone GrpE (heat shock protein)